jgi:hypothetical protein
MKNNRSCRDENFILVRLAAGYRLTWIYKNTEIHQNLNNSQNATEEIRGGNIMQIK